MQAAPRFVSSPLASHISRHQEDEDGSPKKSVILLDVRSLLKLLSIPGPHRPRSSTRLSQDGPCLAIRSSDHITDLPFQGGLQQ